MRFIDLHSHVLPALDDGPVNLDDALRLAVEAVREGVVVLAATPHLRPDYPAVVPSELAGRVAVLQDALRANHVDLDLVVGGELDLLWAHEADDADLRAVSYGGRGHDLLVETPYGEVPSSFEQWLFEVSARGYRILLGHPERSATFQRDTRRLEALVERGVLLQVTAASLASQRPGSRSRALSLELVRRGLAHVIASDSHGPGIARDSVRAGVDAAAVVAPRRAQWMATDAPAAILTGDELPPAPRDRRAVRKWWHR